MQERVFPLSVAGFCQYVTVVSAFFSEMYVTFPFEQTRSLHVIDEESMGRALAK